MFGKIDDEERKQAENMFADDFEYPDFSISGEYGKFQSQYEKYKAQLITYPEFEYLKYEDDTPKSDGELFYPEMLYENKLRALNERVNELRYKRQLAKDDFNILQEEQSKSDERAEISYSDNTIKSDSKKGVVDTKNNSEDFILIRQYLQ